MSVFDPFHHDHINTPRKHPPDNPLELQMVGGCRMKTGGVITPPWGGVWINHWFTVQWYVTTGSDGESHKIQQTWRRSELPEPAEGNRRFWLQLCRRFKMLISQFFCAEARVLVVGGLWLQIEARCMRAQLDHYYVRITFAV